MQVSRAPGVRQRRIAPELDETLEIEVRTDDGKPDKHRVIFNRAVAASQAFGRKFEDLDEWLTTHKNAPIEDWPDAKARDWLQNGLLDQIEDFIARARDGTWTLDRRHLRVRAQGHCRRDQCRAQTRRQGARPLSRARRRRADDSRTKPASRRLPVARKRARVTTKIFHDKFIVLGKLKRTAMSQPRAVLCGSTNFTENGVYRQANVVHVANDGRIAGTLREDCSR